jgi:alkanesulfonate monooxygenase SsuD/methylene tetrahydromethanopterin reductase-like flavin-dependent oxidoreductase (luciferase family)
MEFGIFDHIDRGNGPLHLFFEERLKLTEIYDRLDFYAYHVAEHHFTPLGMAASPSVFLSAVAQRTRRLRFGAMVYTLPLYHPLRLAEEICMLDQLSGGRLQIGVGRGISPLETAYYGENPDVEVARKIYAETLQILLSALSQERVSFAGQYRRADNVPMQLAPVQKPHPPLWMGALTLQNAEYAAQHGMNFISLVSPAEMRRLVERFRAVWQGSQGTASDPKMGLSFFIVVADTDSAAQEIAARSYKRWHKSFHYLYHLHGRSPVFGERAAEFAQVQGEGRGIAGSPATVLAFLRSQIGEAGMNYLVGQFMFGDMAFHEALRSVELFAEHVMPALRAEARQTVAA